MKMKQISARNMREAMNMARHELGEDAVLLESRQTANGGITVVFAIEAEDEVLFDDSPDPGDVQPFTPHIPRAATAGVEIAHPALEIIGEAIRYHSLPAPLAEKLMLRVSQTRFTAGALLDVAETALAEAIDSLLTFKPIATAAEIAPARAIMLVGGHGAGKSTAIAKLATELTLHKKRVVLISADSERMGAADTLGRLAGILKCDFHVVESRADLKPLIKQYLAQSWVLIDTAGVNVYEFQQLKNLGELATLQGVEPILACPAGIDAIEAQEMASGLSFLDVERMIVTRADATRRLSSVFAAQASGGLAFANLSSSASPSETCSPMSAAGLARLMLRHAREKLTH